MKGYIMYFLFCFLKNVITASTNKPMNIRGIPTNIVGNIFGLPKQDL
ncbi:hypothetical protein SAMN05444267_100299 [Chryseobacterium polytrichastri]|uniref:Uncharacterized protein n=1 Tax=Chryseobacterium polytrichastri TaxID=1302687 RepID=A0A1M6QV24_9FLAO|nr:hypothetical protein SAMN05444267_100299 [Chryseobacterium polytrichastri]